MSWNLLEIVKKSLKNLEESAGFRSTYHVITSTLSIKSNPFLSFYQHLTKNKYLINQIIAYVIDVG